MSSLVLLHFNNDVSLDGILSFFGTIIGIFITYVLATKQIRMSEKPFVEFSLSSKDSQYIRNIGTKSAINVEVYKVFLDITKTSRFYSIFSWLISKLFPKNYGSVQNFLRNLIMQIFPANKYANVTLEKSFGTILPQEEKLFSLLPLTNSQELFLVQFENINGEAYQSILLPTNGRGDFEKLYPPRKVFFKLSARKVWGNGKHIKLSRHLLKAYRRD